MAGKKKEAGEGSKKAQGQARKAAAEDEKKAVKGKQAAAVEDEEWSKGSKDNSKKYASALILPLVSWSITYDTNKAPTEKQQQQKPRKPPARRPKRPPSKPKN